LPELGHNHKKLPGERTKKLNAFCRSWWWQICAGIATWPTGANTPIIQSPVCTSARAFAAWMAMRSAWVGLSGWQRSPPLPQGAAAVEAGG